MKERLVRTPRSYSDEEIEFLDRHRGEMNHIDLRARFVAEFGREDITYFNITALFHRMGWRKPKRHVQWTEAELALIRARQDITRPELHRLIVETFGRSDVTPDDIQRACSRRGLKTERAHCNETAPIGHERIGKDGIEIKVANEPNAGDRNFKFKHRWLWEQTHGPIPTGYVLKCLDGNKLNVDLSNWICIPPALAGRLRARNFDRAPAELKPTILAIARLEYTAKQARK